MLAMDYPHPVGVRQENRCYEYRESVGRCEGEGENEGKPCSGGRACVPVRGLLFVKMLW